MLELDLYREPSRVDGTRGDLMHGDNDICKMFELPWFENKNDTSCIPPATYLVKYLKESASGKYADCYVVIDVAGRTGILWHTGNWAGSEADGFKSDSDGCMLPCMGFTKIGGQTMGQHSADAMQAIHAVTGRKDFKLNIWGV